MDDQDTLLAQLQQYFAQIPDARGALVRMATGKTQEQLQDDVALGRTASLPFKLAPDASNLDKGVHMWAAYNAANRMGAGPASMLGVAKEGADLVGQALGKGTSAELGDIAANEAGIDAAIRDEEKRKKQMASDVDYGRGLSGAKISAQPAASSMLASILAASGLR